MKKGTFWADAFSGERRNKFWQNCVGIGLKHCFCRRSSEYTKFWVGALHWVTFQHFSAELLARNSGPKTAKSVHSLRDSFPFLVMPLQFEKQEG